MDTCGSCRAELASEWNYCVRCGTAVPAQAAEQIPGAIRPSAADVTSRKRPDGPVMVWAVLAVIGLPVIIYVVVNLISGHAR